MGPGDAVGIVLQLLIQGDDVQYVQQLPLIFVEPLDLHVENGVGVQGHTLSFHRKNQIIAAMDKCRHYNSKLSIPSGKILSSYAFILLCKSIKRTHKHAKACMSRNSCHSTD